MEAQPRTPVSDPESALEPGTVDLDQRVYLYLEWPEFERFLDLRGDAPAPRITYLDGVLELMSPSNAHESDKKKLARLIEMYAWLLGLDLEGYGSWTLKTEERRGGVEPDECYVRDRAEPGERPDLAIEVVYTSGGLSKLEAYRRLGVGEVWYWADGRLQLFALRGAEYVSIEASAVLPEVDLELLGECMGVDRQGDAVRHLAGELTARGLVTH